MLKSTGVISIAQPYGHLVGTDARLQVLNKRWRTVPDPKSLSCPYEWELQSRSLAPGSPFILKNFMDDGAKFRRNARCPLFLSNYISLDSPNLEGIDEIFRDNTIYFLDATTCVMQNTWLTSALESKIYGPYFLNMDIPLMRSTAVVLATSK